VKGIVLAGGTGSRLFPLTKITNKHLLPIYDKPMIFYPIQALVDAGISDILLVTGGRNSGDFLRLLANGKEFGLAHELAIEFAERDVPRTTVNETELGGLSEVEYEAEQGLAHCAMQAGVCCR